MTRLFKIVVVLMLALVVVGAFLALGKQPSPFPATSQSAQLLEPGPLAVIREEHTFVDDSRPTNANGDYPGSPTRELVGSVWYPDSLTGAPYPLVVYSHGFSSMREGGAYLAELLASLGYIVVAVDYPLTNGSAPGGPAIQDVANQPADVSFLIDTLLAASQTEGDPLFGKVDPERIGATGISLGGMTTTMAAFHPEMGDARIKAALSIAGPTEQFTPVFFSFRSVPFLMLATDTDALVPYNSNALPVLDKVPNSHLVTIKQASHTGFAGPAGALRWMSNPDALGCYMVLSNISDEELETQPWYDLLGTEAQGINYESNQELCTVDPLPDVMNPLRQQMITSVVVRSFFQSQFAGEAQVRQQAQDFLAKTLAAELDEVEYASAL